VKKPEDYNIYLTSELQGSTFNNSYGTTILPITYPDDLFSTRDVTGYSTKLSLHPLTPLFNE